MGIGLTDVSNLVWYSPELVANLGQDYSVYAYDYSELGVPLVGCGMLSWAMTTVNSNSASRVMITGRVCSNSFGFFSNDGVKETLEVKLKLTPVQTFTQAQFVESVHAYNALAKAIPGGFDASAWTNYLNANPNILAPSGGLSSARPKVLSNTQPLQSAGECTPASCEESGEPLQKKARTGPPKPRKSNAPRKKKSAAPTTPAPLESIPEVPPLAPPPPPQMSPTPTPREICAAVPGVTANNPPTPVPTTIFSPSYTNSPSQMDSRSMRSSPPTQPEQSRNVISPTPTSPVLPSPSPDSVPPFPDDLEQRLEALFEEEEEETKPPETDAEQPTADGAPDNNYQADNQTATSSFLELPKIIPATFPDNATMSAAPSPEASQDMSKPKPTRKRKYPKKPKAFTSDAVASSDFGEGEGVKKPRGERPQPKPRTAAHVKERIEMQLVQAVTQGKMPNFCMNCGAIETPTWRKVMIPGEEGDTDSKEKSEKEILLCNPCGLWHASHKTMRPQDYWDGKKEELAAPSKKPRVRKRKPPSGKRGPKDPQIQSTTQLSETPLEPIVVLDEEDTPRQLPIADLKFITMTPKGNKSSRGSNPEWEAASRASKRMFQSSPVKPGTADSPIDLDDVESKFKSPRRLLFDVPTNPNMRPQEVNAGHSKPSDPLDKPTGIALAKEAEKENRAPEELNTDKMAESEINQPVTPKKRRLPPMYPQTPTRSMRSAGSVGSPTPWNAAIFASGKKGPGGPTPERRLIKTPSQRRNLSPTSAFLEKLLEDTDLDNAPRNVGDISIDAFGSSPLGLSDHTFNFADDIFGTDMSMPSSPPLFDMGDDSVGNNALWSDFLPSTPNLTDIGYTLGVLEDIGPLGGETANGTVKDGTSSPVPTPSTSGARVDFSSFIDDATKSAVEGTDA